MNNINSIIYYENNNNLNSSNSLVNNIINGAFADNTQKTYNKGIKLFTEFIKNNEFKNSTNEDVIILFLYHLKTQGKNLYTIKTYLAGVKRLLNLNNIIYNQSQISLAIKSVSAVHAAENSVSGIRTFLHFMTDIFKKYHLSVHKMTKAILCTNKL